MATSLAHLRNDVASADVILVCGDREFPVHRLVLSAQSDYFRSLPTETRQTKVCKLITPEPITPDILDGILDFMYTGCIPDRIDDADYLRSIVASCHVLRLDELFGYYLQQLAEYLSASDIEGLFHLLIEHEDTGWAVHITSHLVNKFCHIHKRQDFLNLDVKQLTKFLQHLKSDEVSAEELKKSVLAWLNFNKSKSDDVLNITSILIIKHLIPDLKAAFVNNNTANEIETVVAVEESAAGVNAIPESSDCKDGGQKLICFHSVDRQGFVRYYDIEADSWSTSEELPFHLLYGAAIVAFDKHIYFLGGSGSSRAGGSAEVTVYCPATNTSVYKGGLSFPVVSALAAVLRDSIYVVGGKNWLNHLFATHRVQCYNPATGECKEVEKTYNGNWNCQVFVFQDYLYVVDLDAESTCIERYDAGINQWSVVTDTKYGFKFNHLQSSFINDRVFLTVDKNENILHVYEAFADKWKLIKYDGPTRKVLQMWSATIAGRQVLLAHSASSNFLVYDIESNTWEKRPGIVDLQKNCGCFIMSIHRTYQSQPIPMNHLMPSLHSMRMASQLTDVVLVCNGGRQLVAHSVVLSSASPYFQSMLSSDFQEAQTGVVNLPTLSYEVMENALQFIYTGRTKNSSMGSKQLIELLSVAHLMDMHNLFHFCLLMLSKQLSTDNFQQMFQLSEMYSSSFCSHVVTFVVRNIEEIVRRDDFRDVDVLLLKRILHHPQLQNPSSLEWFVDAVIECAVCDNSWITFVDEMLSFIHPVYLSPKCLTHIVEPDIVKRNGKSLTRNTSEIQQREVMKTKKNKISLDKLLSIGWNSELLKYEVRIYDVNKDEWSESCHDFPTPLPNGAALTIFDTFVYFFGGVKDGCDEALTQIVKYCPYTNSASVVGELRYGVTDASVGILDDAIYVIGCRSEKHEYIQPFQRFVPYLGLCEDIAPNKERYVKPIVLSFKDLIYVFGSASGKHNVIECYNSLLDQWTVVTQLPTVYDRCTSAICQGKLYLLSQSDKVEPKMYVYDLASDDWELLLDIKRRTLQQATELITVEKDTRPGIIVLQCNRYFKFYDVSTLQWEKHLQANLLPWEKDINVYMRLP